MVGKGAVQEGDFLLLFLADTRKYSVTGRT
jgi:hypothetical protein